MISTNQTSAKTRGLTGRRTGDLIGGARDVLIAVDLDARWRKQPASEGQQTFLRHVKRWREGMSNGAASGTIAAFKSRRGVAEYANRA